MSKCKHDKEILKGYVCDDCLRDISNWTIQPQPGWAEYQQQMLDKPNASSMWGLFGGTQL